MMKQYFPFIDVAKGVGIMAVMMSHCGTFIFFTHDDITHRIISTFFMPLFFLASGFVSTKVWTERLSWHDLFAAKNFYLLIPFFVVGSISVAVSDFYHNGCFTANPIVKLLTSESNCGYWFLLVLVLYRLIAILGKLIYQKISDNVVIVRKLDSNKYTNVLLPLFVILPIWGG